MSLISGLFRNHWYKTWATNTRGLATIYFSPIRGATGGDGAGGPRPPLKITQFRYLLATSSWHDHIQLFRESHCLLNSVIPKRINLHVHVVNKDEEEVINKIAKKSAKENLKPGKYSETEIFLLSYARKVLLICKIDFFYNIFFVNNFNYSKKRVCHFKAFSVSVSVFSNLCLRKIMAKVNWFYYIKSLGGTQETWNIIKIWQHFFVFQTKRTSQRHL